MNKTGKTASLLVAGLLLALGGIARGAADDAQFLHELRERRLFGLAERHCRQRLADSQLGEVERGELTVELLRTLAEQATNEAPAERDAVWQAAREVAVEFERQHQENPRVLLVRVQDALTVLARGELARQEAETAAQPESALEAARQSIRESARLLDGLDKELTREIPLRNRAQPGPGELSGEELLSLQNHVRYQLARALRNQALCYPPGSEDQIAALSGALAQLDQVPARIAADDPLIWQVRVDQVVCLRELGELAKAKQLAEALRDEQAPAAIRLRGRAEEARLELAAGRANEALAILSAGREIDGRQSPELDFAIHQAYVSLWRQANTAQDEQAIARWGEKANEMADFLEREHGPYWGRRASLLLVGAAPADAAAVNMNILARTADELYRKQQYDEALGAYERAAALASAGGQADLALALFNKAAAVEFKRGRFGQAAERFRSAATAHRTLSGAPAAHLLAIYSTAETARSDSTALLAYEELLQEHQLYWPDSPTADEVRMLAARLYRSRGAWAEAIAACEDVAHDSPKFGEAVDAAIDAWSAWLAELKSAGDPYSDHAEAAAQFFESAILGPDRQWPDEWTAQQRRAATAAAHVRLQYGGGNYASAEQVLRAALAGQPAPDDAWIAEAKVLLVAALAAQPQKRGAAAEALGQTAQSPPQHLLAAARLVASLAESAAADRRSELAQLQLQAAELALAGGEGLAVDEKLAAKQLRASALLVGGNRGEALEIYRELAAANPRDGDLQERFAQALLDGDDPQHWAEALDQWRRVAAGSPRDSERWYRAKYGVALSQYKLGQKEEAARLIRYLQLSARGFDDSPLAAKFQELLQRCEQ